MDITELLRVLAQALAIVILAIGTVAGRHLLAWLGLSITQQQADLLDQIAGNGLNLAIARASGAIAAQGWDHPQVKNQILRDAMTYLQANAAGGLAKAGIDVSDREVSAARLQPILERSFASAMQAASVSPATPPVPAPLVVPGAAAAPGTA